MFEDKDITCVDCNNTFVFSVDDQQYHADKGYTNEPKRCPDCRRSRRSGGGYGDGGIRQMHQIQCAQCGKDDEVPFKPRGDRPVYCSDCFTKNRPAATSF